MDEGWWWIESLGGIEMEGVAKMMDTLRTDRRWTGRLCYASSSSSNEAAQVEKVRRSRIEPLDNHGREVERWISRHRSSYQVTPAPPLGHDI